MRHRLPLILPSLVLAIALVATQAVSALAQTPNEDGSISTPQDEITLSAIPPRLGDERELMAKPGEKIQTVIKVRNSSSAPVPISTLVEDFVLGEDGQTPVPVTDAVSNRWSLASWVTISPANQVVQPRQTAQVNVLISVPEDALPGGHYAMVTHEPGAGGDAIGSEPTQSRVAQRVGTLLYFLVDGPINEEAFIRNFNMPGFTEYGPVPYSFTVENLSDVHIKPQTGIEIFNMFGRRVDTIIVEPKNVFPLMSREFTGQWDQVWGFGPYTAKITMSFGDQGRIVVSSTRFWLVPVKLLLAIGIVLIALIGAIVAIRRHMLHRSSAEQERIRMLEGRLQELEQDRQPLDQ